MSTPEKLLEADQTGMTIAYWAQKRPEQVAVYDPDGTPHTYAKVNQWANKLARFLRDKGAKPGDSLALICTNRAEFVEVWAATQRTGLRITPINWHLTADEIDYIVQDCEARFVVGDVLVPSLKDVSSDNGKAVVYLSIGGGVGGFSDYHETLVDFDGSDIDDPVLGNSMMYTSGTTGRPKGVFRGKPTILPRANLVLRGYDENSVQMCCGPAYHAAPLAFDIRTAHMAGIPVVLMDKWDTENTLRTIAERNVTHMHLVPIMFQRLLDLPDDVKVKYPVDHVRYIVHGAAPCSIEVKQAMIDWFGPILSEYYAGSEGGAGFTITSEEWLKKPGSVGKRPQLLGVRIIGENGEDLPNGESGTIYMQLPPGGGFTYYKDDAKTNKDRRDDYFTMGDIGFFDEDDYLFLTGRSAETIISGGVNIYPQEIDNELIKHPSVEDSATVGVPHDEWGEQVKSVIQLKTGIQASDDLASEITTFLRNILPGFKVPRSIDFVTELPRSDAGKIQRGKVRQKYWEGRSRQI